jgi:type I restriction enzyme S subunit
VAPKNLPKGWALISISQLGEIQLGRQRSPKKLTGLHSKPYIRAANITNDGLKVSDILEMDFEGNELVRYRLEAGDIVLSEASGSADHVGKPALWKNEIPECYFQNTVIRLRPALVEHANYIFHVLKAYYLSGTFAKVGGGVGINHLSANKFSVLPFPLCSNEEQTQIIQELESRLSVVDQLEKTIEQSLQKSEALRQSILKKAFAGELVPQDH